jgi:hypothetical protein
MRSNAAVGSFERMVFQEIKFGLSAVTRFRFISTNDVRIALAIKHDDRDWCDVVAPKPKGESMMYMDLMSLNSDGPITRGPRIGGR